ncbi:MAG TPA: glycoside hydrolase family 2 TIM barrel-domain containing protein, partial [Levilinea sp.]|nr:glycoside hydrolase family 2 TIM barrel-domain containing protein [Levilinea sp.]
LRAALDQDYYPELICTPPSMEYLEAQLRQAKALGLNCMRVHIKIADPRYYTAADRVGMLIWTELPNWKYLTDASRRRARATLDGMLERDWNHPSIIIWTIINENWGTDLTHNAAHRAWISETYHHLKSIDPLRLVVDNSACHGNYHVVTDLEDYHYYSAQPDHYLQWREWVDSFASRPGWTFAPELEDIEAWQTVLKDHWNPAPRRYAPEVQRKGDEPLLMSEFGNWGLPDIDRLRAGYGGHDPWWFQTGYNWGDGVVNPHGVEQRFRDYHLGRIFGSLSGLSKASQELQFQALKYEIEQLRRRPTIQGYVITEFTDLHWECNGLLDMCRNPKIYYDRFQTINNATVIVPEWERLAYRSGETCQVILLVAHHGAANLTGSRMTWQLEAFPEIRGELGPLDIEPYGVSGAGAISFRVPPVTSPQRSCLMLALVDHDGKTAAENTLEFAVFPLPEAKRSGVTIFAPELGESLAALGYPLAASLDDAQVAVTPQLSQAYYRYLQGGGQVLWLAECDPKPSPLSQWQVIPRTGSHWQGDWASSLSWISGDGPFRRLPSCGAVDFLFAGITPEHVISGVTPDEFAGGVHAGIFVGWLQHNAALVAERRVGEGRLLISTFQLSQNWKTHPVAEAMLTGLVQHLARSSMPA